MLVIKPLEPLHFGKTQIPGIDLAGRDAAFTAPPPSTILGLLASIKGINYYNKPKPCNRPLEDLKTTYRELTGEELTPTIEGVDRPLIWGPVVYIEKIPHIPIEGGYFVPRGEMEKYIDNAAGENSKIKIKKATVNIKPGIALDPTSKTPRYGYLYGATYVGYPLASEIRYVVNMAIPTDQNYKGVYRLGGEGRLAQIELREKPVDIRGEKPEGESKKSEDAIVLTPLLFQPEDGYARTAGHPKGPTPGLECVEEIRGIYTGDTFKIVAEPMGLGYSEVCNRRRPLYYALPPGTVVKIKCKYKAVGLFSQLGYGAIIRTKDRLP
ncbi:type III-B CRISPR module-associated Cmr3 family protein [Pyrobaculum ferrireducens]|uniref:type III-B CRISPR module-associated Cmr3 family protein n=1 Tax=Pyrobaculum ferrireducens TaxID=1104324 RepID=UPI0013054598|nr:type III-B CRISPR module-associated Cmr3 family protein [Pyrobaculum ferrireducens]